MKKKNSKNKHSFHTLFGIELSSTKFKSGQVHLEWKMVNGESEFCLLPFLLSVRPFLKWLAFQHINFKKLNFAIYQS